MKQISYIFAKYIFLIISSESIKMGKTYQRGWEKDCHWLKSVKGYKTKAYYTLCKKGFRIENSGVSQVNSHSKGPVYSAKEDF